MCTDGYDGDDDDGPGLTKIFICFRNSFRNIGQPILSLTLLFSFALSPSLSATLSLPLSRLNNSFKWFIQTSDWNTTTSTSTPQLKTDTIGEQTPTDCCNRTMLWSWLGSWADHCEMLHTDRLLYHMKLVKLSLFLSLSLSEYRLFHLCLLFVGCLREKLFAINAMYTHLRHLVPNNSNIFLGATPMYFVNILWIYLTDDAYYIIVAWSTNSSCTIVYYCIILFIIWNLKLYYFFRPRVYATRVLHSIYIEYLKEVNIFPIKNNGNIVHANVNSLCECVYTIQYIRGGQAPF